MLAKTSVNERQVLGGSAADIELHYRIMKGPRLFTEASTGKGPYLDIVIHWTLTFRWPGQPTIIVVELDTRPSGSIMTVDDDSTYVYGHMLFENSAALRSEAARAFGLDDEH